ncbi:serine hydrolase domain-containing protein [Fodinicurvata sp. EGI_FJ10296]|uniref:serine hydrolase domain-containing protein n=1 Tax=Fodinicurvata sp. EGI_FJ10296 TaxID=3231908 RepID=UPI003453DE80
MIASTVGRLMLAALLTLAPGLSPLRADTLPLEDRLAETIPARMALDDVPGVVVVLIERGAAVWTAAFGFSDPETDRPMTEDALFRVESISKPVTAWGAMRLAETGRFDLDAPVSDCLTRWQPPAGTPLITGRQLLSHSAGVGLGDYAARYAPDAPRPRLPTHLAEDFAMIGAPGAQFAYSDTGYNLLELAIEDCTEEDFSALMGREILVPLGMARASFDWSGAEMPVGHDLHGQPVAPYLYPGRGSGGLFATAADIARFAVAAMAGADQDVLSPEGIAALHRPGVPVGGLFSVAAEGYGLGHFTEVLSDGRAAVWHGGQGYGWMSHLHMVPETGDGIVILSNSQRAWPLFAAILRDWSESLGVEQVGMARVLWAETAARATIALLIAGAVLALWLAFRGRPRRHVTRIGVGGIAAALMLWPLWAAAQDYLFLFSILPGLWPWLGVASALCGIGLTAIAIGPERRT